MGILSETQIHPGDCIPISIHQISRFAKTLTVIHCQRFGIKQGGSNLQAAASAPRLGRGDNNVVMETAMVKAVCCCYILTCMWHSGQRPAGGHKVAR